MFVFNYFPGHESIYLEFKYLQGAWEPCLNKLAYLKPWGKPGKKSELKRPPHHHHNSDTGITGVVTCRLTGGNISSTSQPYPVHHTSSSYSKLGFKNQSGITWEGSSEGGTWLRRLDWAEFRGCAGGCWAFRPCVAALPTPYMFTFCETTPHMWMTIQQTSAFTPSAQRAACTNSPA